MYDTCDGVFWNIKEEAFSKHAEQADGKDSGRHKTPTSAVVGGIIAIKRAYFSPITIFGSGTSGWHASDSANFALWCIRGAQDLIRRCLVSMTRQFGGLLDGVTSQVYWRSPGWVRVSGLSAQIESSVPVIKPLSERLARAPSHRFMFWAPRGPAKLCCGNPLWCIEPALDNITRHISLGIAVAPPGRMNQMQMLPLGSRLSPTDSFAFFSRSMIRAAARQTTPSVGLEIQYGA
ncbi:hypothetical protein H4582DRAFT_2059416 [Lactarius indigo]|nr:hypothetical protein H4582DRAFT_2059416 [Lactarius indigo]